MCRYKDSKESKDSRENKWDICVSGAQLQLGLEIFGLFGFFVPAHTDGAHNLEPIGILVPVHTDGIYNL